MMLDVRFVLIDVEIVFMIVELVGGDVDGGDAVSAVVS